MKPDIHWKNLEEYKDSDLSELLNLRTITRLPSISPLEKLKKNLLINSILGMVIIALYIFILASFSLWQVRLCIGIVLLFTIWGTYSAFELYRKINEKDHANSCLKEMEHYYKSITHWMSLQQRMGIFVYPVSAAGGFMLGGFLGSGKPIDEFMSNPKILLALLLVTVILVPLCFKMAKWMCKKSFGQYADQLKKNIIALKSEK